MNTSFHTKKVKKLNLSNETELRELYSRPKKNKIAGRVSESIYKKNIFHQMDILYFTEDWYYNDTFKNDTDFFERDLQQINTAEEPYKYILVICDVYNSVGDARPLKTREHTEILDQIKSIYESKKYLEMPKYMEADNEFRSKIIEDYFKDNECKLFFSKPYHHKAMGYVENYNAYLGYYLWLVQLDNQITYSKEHQTDDYRTDTRWVQLLPRIVSIINDGRKHKKTRDLSALYINGKLFKQDGKLKLKPGSEELIKEGSYVRIALDEPVDYQTGEKEFGRFRLTDIRFSKEIYRVNKMYWMTGQPPLYRVEDLEGNVIPSLYNYYDLKLVEPSLLTNEQKENLLKDNINDDPEKRKFRIDLPKKKKDNIPRPDVIEDEENITLPEPLPPQPGPKKSLASQYKDIEENARKNTIPPFEWVLHQINKKK